MQLMLERIEQRLGAQVHLYPLDLTLVPLAVTVLLGATQAGKTTLMRALIGLDGTFGTVLEHRTWPITNVAVRPIWYPNWR